MNQNGSKSKINQKSKIEPKLIKIDLNPKMNQIVQNPKLAEVD